MNIMNCRYEWLQQTLAGYVKTGMQLIGTDGTNVFPSAYLGDDLGIYYFIPKLVWLLNISLDRAIELFFCGMVALSFLLAIIGFFLLSSSFIVRVIAALAIAKLSHLACCWSTDVYLSYYCIAFSVVPLMIYFMRKRVMTIPFGFFSFLSGIGIGYAHYIRGFSGLPVLLFVVVSSLFYFRVPWKKKFFLIFLVLLGLMIPVVHFSYLFYQRQAYFGADYVTHVDSHPFWHNIYIGLGFLNNRFGIRWNDGVAIEKMKQIEPDAVYPTQEYEKVARGEVFRLIKKHTRFVLTTIFAKIGVLLLYLLVFANIGLVAAFFYRKPWGLELSFWLALLFSSVFALLALPEPVYLFGFIAFACLYGLVSIDFAIQKGVLRDISTFLCKDRR